MTPEEFDEIKKTYYEMLFDFAQSKFALSNNGAENIVQKCFNELWEKRENTEDIECIYSFLQEVVCNKGKDLKRIKNEYKKKTDQYFREELPKGSPIAFKELYFSYYALLCNYVKFMFNLSKEDVEYIVQECLTKLWEKRKDTKGIECFEAFLKIMARNGGINFMKKKDTRTKYESSDEYKLRRLYEDICENDLFDERHEILNDAIDKLSENWKRVVKLQLEKYSIQEIAELLNLTVRSVESILSRAKGKLMDILVVYIEDQLLELLASKGTESWDNIVADVVSELPDKIHKVITLLFKEGLRKDDIAHKLSIKPIEVVKYYTKAIRKINESIGDSIERELHFLIMAEGTESWHIKQGKLPYQVQHVLKLFIEGIDKEKIAKELNTTVSRVINCYLKALKFLGGNLSSPSDCTGLLLLAILGLLKLYSILFLLQT